MPDLLAVVLVFWRAPAAPRGRAWPSSAWLMDVHDGALLGQHALAYSAAELRAIMLHRRLLWFHCRPGGAGAAAVLRGPCDHAGRLLVGGMWPGWSLLLLPPPWPLAACCCWRRSACAGPDALPLAARRCCCPPALPPRRAGSADPPRSRTSPRGAPPRAAAGSDAWSLKNSTELARFRRAAAAASCCSASGCWSRGWCAAGAAARQLRRAGRGQPHRGGAHRAQPRPDPGPQRRGAGHQLLGLHAGDHPSKVGTWTDHRRAGQAGRHPAARPRRFKRLLEEARASSRCPSAPS
jgi:hypothetical protein